MAASGKATAKPAASAADSHAPVAQMDSAAAS